MGYFDSITGEFLGDVRCRTVDIFGCSFSNLYCNVTGVFPSTAFCNGISFFNDNWLFVLVILVVIWFSMFFYMGSFHPRRFWKSKEVDEMRIIELEDENEKLKKLLKDCILQKR